MNKEILRLAIPNIISNISIPLLSTVDTALMGRMSILHVGAVGLGSMIFNFIYWNFGFLRMGTTGMTAQAFGQKNNASIINTLGRALITSLVLAFLVMALMIPLGNVSFQLLEAQDNILVSDYFYTRIWAAPATLGLYAFMGWFFGMQNAIYPLILTIVINVANIGFNFLFVYHFGMDVKGVALGTVIAQYIGIILAFFLFYYKYAEYLKHVQKEVLLKWEDLKKFLSINSDIFLRTLCLTFAFGFFYNRSSGGGDTILAVNVILLQFVNWMSYGVDGFAFASESLVGKYAGAKDRPNTNKAIRLSFIWGMVLAILFAAVYGLFGKELLYIFTDKENLVDASIPFLYWMVLYPILAFPCYLWDGIFIGLTASKAMRNSMLVSVLLYVLAYFIFMPTFDNNRLWLILLIFMVARGAIQTLLYFWKGLSLR